MGFNANYLVFGLKLSMLIILRYRFGVLFSLFFSSFSNSLVGGSRIWLSAFLDLMYFFGSFRFSTEVQCLIIFSLAMFFLNFSFTKFSYISCPWVVSLGETPPLKYPLTVGDSHSSINFSFSFLFLWRTSNILTTGN